MNKWMQLPLALAMVAALACDRGDRMPGDAGTVGTSGSAGVDRDFVEDQLAAGDAEVELGRVALERAGSAEVRDFANMMVRDHRKAGDELKQIASRHNLRVEAGAHDDHNELRERLAKLSGSEFDRAYMEAMVNDHQKAVDAVEEEADGSDNADVKRWAAATLPTLKQHLERAKQIQSNLPDADNRRR